MDNRAGRSRSEFRALYEKFKLSSREKKILIIFAFVCFMLSFAVVRSLLEIGSLVPLWGCYYAYASYLCYSGMPFWRTLLACYGVASFGIICIYTGTTIFQIVFTKIKSSFLDNLRGRKSINEIRNEIKTVASLIRVILEDERESTSLLGLYADCAYLLLKGLVKSLIAFILYLLWYLLAFFKKCFSESKSGLGKTRDWLGALRPVVFLRKQLSRLKSKFPHSQKKEKVKLTKRFGIWLSKRSVWFILFILFIPCPYTDPAAAIAMRLKNQRFGLWYLLGVNVLHVLLIVGGIYFLGLKFWS